MPLDLGDDKPRAALRETGRGEDAAVITLRNPPASYSTIVFSTLRSADRLRVELPHPSGFDLPGPARLAAVQVIGPWDGQDR